MVIHGESGHKTTKLFANKYSGFGQAVSEYKAIAQGLGSAGVLQTAEVESLRQMAGYRNRMVHFYHKLSVEELYEICTKEGLADMERIVAAVERWIRANPERVDEGL